MRPYHDDTHDVDLKSRHHCTDLPCFIVFLFAIAAFACLYIYCGAEGQIGRIEHGVDYAGRVCGVDAAVVNQPYLYWCPSSSANGVLELELENPICVTKCPGADDKGGGTSPLFAAEPGCLAVTGAEGITAYRTVVLFNRYCLPHSGFTEYEDIAKHLTGGQLTNNAREVLRSMSSIPSAWPVLIGAFLISIVVGYLFLLFVRHCAELLIWVSMGICIVCCGWLGILLWTHASRINDLSVAQDVHDLDNNEDIAKVLAAVCWALTIGLVFMACCLRHSVAAAAACIEVACDEMFEMPSLLLLPLFKSVVKGIIFIIVLNGFLLLLSTAHTSEGGDGTSRTLEYDGTQYGLMVFYILMSFWFLAFVNAVYQFTVAYAVAEYYYTEYDHDEEKDVGCCAIWDGLHVGLLYHTGSLAFGSFLIAFLETIQKVLEYAAKQSEKSGNHALNCILCCCICCVHWCTDVVEVVNKNAYIDLAITSDTFCEAARSAVGVIASMGEAMLILNGATFAFTVFGTILITLCSGGFTYAVASCSTFADQASRFYIDSPVTAMIVAMLIGFYVAMCFMDMLDMASDTLLYCYGLDLKTGKAGHTAPAALKDLVHCGEHGKAPEVPVH